MVLNNEWRIVRSFVAFSLSPISSWDRTVRFDRWSIVVSFSFRLNSILRSNKSLKIQNKAQLLLSLSLSFLTTKSDSVRKTNDRWQCWRRSERQWDDRQRFRDHQRSTLFRHITNPSKTNGPHTLLLYRRRIYLRKVRTNNPLSEMRRKKIFVFFLFSSSLDFSFYADFGPLNLGALHRYCSKLNRKINVNK